MVNKDVLSVAQKIYGALGDPDEKSFLCFGTLLHFIRDREFSIESDVDIGIIGSSDKFLRVFADQFIPCHMVKDDVTGEPYQVTMRTTEGVCIDLFFWKKKNGMYYHCYDDRHVFSETGILKEYTFKGTPAACFEVPAETIKARMQDFNLRGVRSNGVYMKNLPQDQTSGMTFPVPQEYGHCLDIWYPDWAEKRPQFGVSRAAHTFTVKTCSGIKWEG